jgi:hypothetical protein
MRTTIKSIAAIAAVVMVGFGAAFAFGAFDGKDVSCGTHDVAVVKAQNGRDHLTVTGAPPGSVSGGGGQRIEVNGHNVHLSGKGRLTYVRCAK